MPIPEPGDALWAEVSQLTRWPESDEDAVRAMAAGWRDGGGHFTRAGGFDLSPVADGWPDQAGSAFHSRTTQGLRTATTMGAAMAELAGHADAFAAEVTGVKNGIHELMVANRTGFAEASAMPGDVRAGFVRQVAGMVDTMKAEAAGRVAAAAAQPPDGRRPLAEILRDYQVTEDPNGLVTYPPLVGKEVTSAERDVLNQQYPREQLQAWAIKREVEARAEAEFAASGKLDGHQDAFRHIYLNARLTQALGETWTKDLGIAHERILNKASTEAMDLYNNEVGRSIGARHPDATPDELANYVREAVRSGAYTDVAGNRIPAPVVVHDSGGNLAYSDTVRDGETGSAPDVYLPGRDPAQVGLPGG